MHLCVIINTLREPSLKLPVQRFDGFWQIHLSKDSARLTTFISPFGRYYFNSLPFGITSAPEHFQRRMQSILEGIEGVVCHIDDILVYGRDQEEHDCRLKAVLYRLGQHYLE